MSALTVADVLSNAIRELTLNTDNLVYNEPQQEAKLIVSHVCELSFTQLITRADDLVTEQDIARINKVIQARITGVPIAYLLGIQAFWTLELEVSTHTLIPRQDTESVVEIILNLPIASDAHLLDLGTGTGAIALSLASERPKWHVEGCDFKDEIVDLAKRNALANNVGNVQFYKSNWFSSVPAKQYDLIVSNPPYVEPDSPYLLQGDLRFEPHSALTASNNGLADIEHLISHARTYLKEGAYLALEHGFKQAQAIQERLRDAGYTDIQTLQDLNHQDRLTLAAFYKTT